MRRFFRLSSGLGARLYGVLAVAENKPTDTVVEPVRCRRANAAAGSGSADFEHVADLPLAARCLLAVRLGAFELPLADVQEDGAEVLILDDGGLRNLPQFVEGGVGQIEATVADRQPAVGIIDYGDALAAELAGDRIRFEQEHDLVVLQGQAVTARTRYLRMRLQLY
jgi:hypothetical protein